MTRPAQSTGSTLRPALTLVEALVLLLLVFIGVAVLLSYLQQVRTAARRAQCMNNLKLIGEAIYYYEGTHDYLQAAKLLGRARGAGHGTLPAARIDDGYATWAVLIAPYLGSDNPLKAWELGKPYAAQPGEARRTWLAEHLCPARARESMLSSSGDAGAGGAHLPGAVGDYACAAGDGDPRHPWTSPDANGAIILGTMLGMTNYNYVLVGYPTGRPLYLKSSNLSGKVYVTGQVALLVTDSFNFASKDYIYLAPGASLTVYVAAPSANLSGVVNSGSALNFQYYGLDSNTSLTFAANAAFTGGIYAPYADFKLNGGGSNIYDFVGASLTKTVTMAGHFKFHFDEAMPDGPWKGYIVTGWDEIDPKS